MIHTAKKSMGQNFLKSQPALRMMCTAANISNTDIVLEIGPGKGALTEKLLQTGATVVAIEKDRDLMTPLEEKFKTEIIEKKLILVNKDILTVDPREYGLVEGKYKISANIPYNITGSIIKRFLSETIAPSAMVLLVQKEVAERIVTRDKKESILSLSVKLYGSPKYIMKVGKRFFSPSPKVDSAIIAITNINKDNCKTKKEEELFFSIIKAAFAHKRKVMRKNLEDIVPLTIIDTMFTKLSINAQVRAEDVPFTTWKEITTYLAQHIG